MSPGRPLPAGDGPRTGWPPGPSKAASEPDRTGCAMTRTRRWSLALAAMAAAALLGAQPALACGGLVGPGGTVQLARTPTLARWHDGVEHYLTSFSYAGGGAKFGSIVPLPGVPSDVRKGGEWTLQRLALETQPQPPEAFRTGAAVPDAGHAAVEVFVCNFAA